MFFLGICSPKKFAVTGWRLGAIIGPREIINVIARFSVNDESCPHHFIRYEAPASPVTQPLIEPLSERELEVLRLVAVGLSNREIAEELYLSINTIKAHTKNIYGKLNAHGRIQAVERARELKLL